MNHISTLIFDFLKVEELERADTHRQVGIDIDEPSQAAATRIPPIHHATPPCHPPTEVVTTPRQIGEFFGIFCFERREHVVGMAYGRNRRFLYKYTIILKQILMKHKSKTLSEMMFHHHVSHNHNPF